MADNLTAPATGAVLATDDVGGVHYPRTKIAYGADGAASDVTTTNRLPVDIGTGPFAVTGQFYQTTQPISASALPLPTGAATQATLAAVLTEATFTTRIPTTGDKAASGSVPVTMSKDQDPVYDHANAVKVSVTTTPAPAITPPASARYLRVHATADTFLRTDGTAAADAAGSILIKAGVPETIPCVGGTAVSAVVVTGTATLYATPTKSR